MAHTPKIDPDQLKSDALQLRDLVAQQAGRAALKAADLAEQGLDWAAPRAQQAIEKTIEKATPVISDAADRAQDAADRAKPYMDDVHTRVVDDYLPRINRAVSDAAAAATTDADLAERARLTREATARALSTPTPVAKKRSHRVAKALGWTALGVSAAGVGYLLWKRSQPIEDPWAEEYWADLETDVEVPDLPAEVDEVVDAAAETVEEVAKTAEDTAEDVATTVEKKVTKAAKAVKDE